MKEGKLGWGRREGGQCAGELVGEKGGREGGGEGNFWPLSLSLLPQIRAHTNASGRAEEETGVEKILLNLFSPKNTFLPLLFKRDQKGNDR